MNINKYFEEKVLDMANLQGEINSLINPDWRSAGNKWYRAIWLECAELMEHVGWKWWKYQEADISQIKLELVDIWHFALSEIIEEPENHEAKFKELAQNMILLRDTAEIDVEKVRHSIEQLSKYALVEHRFNSLSFCEAANACGMSFDELYKVYVGKNILNKFRQLNGYKDGSYSKVWGGKEDNVWLSKLIESTSIEKGDFPSFIYNSLDDIYKKLTKEQG